LPGRGGGGASRSLRDVPCGSTVSETAPRRRRVGKRARAGQRSPERSRRTRQRFTRQRKMAGTESMAKTTSLTSSNSRTTKIGVAKSTPLERTRKRSGSMGRRYLRIVFAEGGSRPSRDHHPLRRTLSPHRPPTDCWLRKTLRTPNWPACRR
jgi:hypothetical protein